MVVFLNVLLSIMTFGMFSLVEVSFEGLTLNDPIAELNGLTLNEVFGDGFYEQELPNGINDSIIDGYKIQRVKKYTLVSEDIIELDNSATNIHYVYINKNTDYLYYGSLDVLGDMAFNLSGYENGVGMPFDVVNIGSVFSRFNMDRYMVLVSPYTYATLTEAQADLVGTDIYYELVMPIETYVGIDTLTQVEMDYWYDIYEMGGYNDVSYTMNEVDLTDIVIIVSSAFIWLFFIRFIKEVL